MSWLALKSGGLNESIHGVNVSVRGFGGGTKRGLATTQGTPELRGILPIAGIFDLMSEDAAQEATNRALPAPSLLPTAQPPPCV
ncbi:MAG: hypothetical protein NTV80_12425 [Verrucomicrobia bacterium]|nr:hypothetical protein [Verrucomicrobiota bacterium]